MIRTLTEMGTMEFLERFRNSFIVAIGIIGVSCTIQEAPFFQTYLESNTSIIQKGGITYSNNQLFTGKLVQISEQKDTLSIRFFLSGKKVGQWETFFSNGNLKEQRFFDENGKKTGEYSAYWENGQKKWSYIFQNDEYNGVCRDWNKDGKLIREMTYKNGHEDGPQKVWYDNGKIKSNYVVKDGKRYGKLGTKNCVTTTDTLDLGI